MSETAINSASTAALASARASSRVCVRLHPQLPVMVIPEGVAAQLEIDINPAPVPNTKPWLRGVLNLRGNLVPVFDVGLWHGLPASDSNRALVVDPGPSALAVLCAETPTLGVVKSGGEVNASDPLLSIASRRYEGVDGVLYELDLPAWVARVGERLAGRESSQQAVNVT